MRYVSIDNLREGDILGEQIERGNVVLAKIGIPLSNSIIKRLKEMGKTGLYIQSELGNDIKVTDLIQEKYKKQAMEDIEKLDISATLSDAKNIVDDILSMMKEKKGNISLDYMESRNAENYLLQHSIAVAEASILIGKSLIGTIKDFDETKLVDLAVAALLHDVGKLFEDKNLTKSLGSNYKLVNENINYNPESHPLYGYNFLLKLHEHDIAPTSRVGVLLHHLNEDGSGFPKFEKPLTNVYFFAKIIHIADAYDNVRHFNGGNNPSYAVEYLKANCNTLFNKQLVDIFLNYVPIYPVSTTVELYDGTHAIVVKQNTGHPDRPVILIIDGIERGRKIDLMDEKDSLSRSTIIVNCTDYKNNIDDKIL